VTKVALSFCVGISDHPFAVIGDSHDDFLIFWLSAKQDWRLLIGMENGVLDDI
jgi:hypothetical protein